MNKRCISYIKWCLYFVTYILMQYRVRNRVLNSIIIICMKHPEINSKIHILLYFTKASYIINFIQSS